MSPRELKHFNLVFHSTEYLKLKRIDHRHFFGKKVCRNTENDLFAV